MYEERESGVAQGAAQRGDEIGDFRCFSCVCRNVEQLLEAYPPDTSAQKAVMADVARLYAEGAWTWRIRTSSGAPMG